MYFLQDRSPFVNKNNIRNLSAGSRRHANSFFYSSEDDDNMLSTFVGFFFVKSGALICLYAIF